MIIPHDDKLHRGGEDAADSNDTFLCVADGVGGWADRGVNPGIFSAELTRSMLMFHEKFPDTDNSAHRLVFKGCNYATKQHLGSATAVALKLIEGMKI